MGFVENKIRKILVEITKDHTVLKMENLIKIANEQYDDYSDELMNAEDKK